MKEPSDFNLHLVKLVGDSLKYVKDQFKQSKRYNDAQIVIVDKTLLSQVRKTPGENGEVLAIKDMCLSEKHVDGILWREMKAKQPGERSYDTYYVNTDTNESQVTKPVNYDQNFCDRRLAG